jgi:hypothetical protein
VRCLWQSWAHTVLVRPSQGSHERHGGGGVDAEEAHGDRVCGWFVDELWWREREDVDQEVEGADIK